MPTAKEKRALTIEGDLVRVQRTLLQAIVRHSTPVLTMGVFQVEREVLSWGDKVEVMAPAQLRQRVRDIAKVMHERHQ